MTSGLRGVSLTIIIAALAIPSPGRGQTGTLVHVDSIQLYVEQLGQGTPLVILHNFGSAGSAWRFMAEPLADHHRVLLVDLPGHGRSSGWGTDRFDYATASRRILAVLEQLNVGRFRLVGASTGGALALRIAADHPERVAALVTIGGFDRVSLEAATLLQQPGCEELTPEQWTRQRQLHAGGDEQIRALQRQFCNEPLNRHPLTPPLGQIEARTLIVHGDHDRLFPADVALVLYKAIPAAYLWIVADGGHIPCLDDRFRAACLDVIKTFVSDSWQPRFK